MPHRNLSHAHAASTRPSGRWMRTQDANRPLCPAYFRREGGGLGDRGSSTANVLLCRWRASPSRSGRRPSDTAGLWERRDRARFRASTGCRLGRHPVSAGPRLRGPVTALRRAGSRAPHRGRGGVVRSSCSGTMTRRARRPPRRPRRRFRHQLHARGERAVKSRPSTHPPPVGLRRWVTSVVRPCARPGRHPLPPLS